MSTTHDLLDAVETPPSRTMTVLPFEISQQIADCLDHQSALRLMRVCKALRTAGEMKVFSEIDLTGAVSGEILTYQFDDLDSAAYCRRSAIVEERLNRIQLSFDQSPHRVEFVKTVRVEPSAVSLSDGRTPSLIHFLGMLAPRLRRLDMLTLPPNTHPNKSPEFETESQYFFRMLNEAEVDFPLLEVLKYAHDTDRLVLDEWMLRMPHLRELEYSASDGIYSFGIQPSTFQDSGMLPHLRRLTIDHLRPHDDGKVLKLLLPHAPNLDFLRLHGSWCPRADDESLLALGSLTHLKTLVLWDDIHEKDSDDESYNGMAKGIHFHRLGKVKLGSEEAAVESWHWIENEELRFEDAAFPMAPKLRRLTILTTPRAPLSDYASCAVGPTPEFTNHIDAKLVHYLRRTPLLHCILLLYLPAPFPLIHDPNFVEPEYFVSPDRWEPEGHRGCILREYHSPPGMEAIRIFWHFRTLSRSVDRADGVTMWGDRRVPRDILKAVYEQAGEDLAFLQGGRGLSLGEGEAAWKILDDWRGTVDDESDEEDDFRLDGTEDDDLLSDEE